jgi:hypothetical protein
MPVGCRTRDGPNTANARTAPIMRVARVPTPRVIAVSVVHTGARRAECYTGDLRGRAISVCRGMIFTSAAAFVLVSFHKGADGPWRACFCDDVEDGGGGDPRSHAWARRSRRAIAGITTWTRRADVVQDILIRCTRSGAEQLVSYSAFCRCGLLVHIATEGNNIKLKRFAKRFSIAPLPTNCRIRCSGSRVNITKLIPPVHVSTE